MNSYYVKGFSTDIEKQWDEFVIHDSVNGTFLQTRNFLNYHSIGKFEDASFLVYHGQKIVAVVPACKDLVDRKTVLHSHKGSTYGGIVVGRNYYSAERLIEIINVADEYAKNYFEEIILKITADIHSNENSDLLQYALGYCGYSNYVELNTYIDLEDFPSDVIEKFDRNKIRNIRKCEERNLQFRELNSDDEIEEFHQLLTINLSKYDLHPIHTTDEIKCFRNYRIPDNVRFYGVFHKTKMMAGGMMFVFDNCNVIHAQNLSADYRFTEYSSITYMYYRVIQQAKDDGYKALSWGISTEDKGHKLNMGLVRNKESYGSKHQLNRTFFKSYSR